MHWAQCLPTVYVLYASSLPWESFVVWVPVRDLLDNLSRTEFLNLRPICFHVVQVIDIPWKSPFTLPLPFISLAGVLKMWSLDQEHQHHLGR